MKNDFYRGRRLRSSANMRALVREVSVEPHDLIAPVFVVGGKNKKIPVESMEGIERISVDQLPAEMDAIRRAGVSNVLLFGVPDEKNTEASQAWKDGNLISNAVTKIKSHDSQVTVITDVCLCAYTDHGHCGHLKGDRIDNDSTLETLSKMAVTHAQSGADVVAPSDMMDGRVQAIRSALDKTGLSDTAILSYSAKYASAFYGPFRDAAQCAPKAGDRKSYQMDPPNGRQALMEIAADIEEGADMIMIKPALAYLDVIRAARTEFNVPIVAYSVSGEYSMVKAAAARGWIDERAVMLEMLYAMKRAGADRIITYYAKKFRA